MIYVFFKQEIPEMDDFEKKEKKLGCKGKTLFEIPFTYPILYVLAHIMYNVHILCINIHMLCMQII